MFKICTFSSKMFKITKILNIFICMFVPDLEMTI
jgi:hypothetical protein